jgi:hypothetical protein
MTEHDAYHQEEETQRREGANVRHGEKVTRYPAMPLCSDCQDEGCLRDSENATCPSQAGKDEPAPVEHNYRICSICAGDGWVIWNGKEHKPCRVCAGTGKIFNGKPAPVAHTSCVGCAKLNTAPDTGDTLCINYLSCFGKKIGENYERKNWTPQPPKGEDAPDYKKLWLEIAHTLIGVGLKVGNDKEYGDNMCAFIRDLHRRAGESTGKVPLDIESMLAAMTVTLAKAISQEQDDTLNDDLCELYELADAFHDKYVEAVHESFKDPEGKPLSCP